jgi:hypothetical protein
MHEMGEHRNNDEGIATRLKVNVESLVGNGPLKLAFTAPRATHSDQPFGPFSHLIGS